MRIWNKITNEPWATTSEIWNKITNEPWATTSDTLENIINIAKRQNANPEAIAAQLGRKLQNTYAVSVRNNVAVIPIHGPLFRYANLFTVISGATSYELLARDFNEALENQEVKAILFDIDSPGGEVNGCSELADMIYQKAYYCLCLRKLLFRSLLDRGGL